MATATSKAGATTSTGAASKPAKKASAGTADKAVNAATPKAPKAAAAPKAKAAIAAVIKAPAAATATGSATKAAKPVTPEQYRYYVEVAAYHIAERRNFAGGNPADDWAQAEAEINRLLASGHLNS